MDDRERFVLEMVSVRLVKDAPVFSNKPIQNAQDAVDVVADLICDMDRELLCIVNMKTDGTPINCHIASMGALNATLSSPREMLKAAILSNAATILMVHNHPSGNLKPSKIDVAITERMIHVTQLMDIQLLDHIIVSPGADRYFSMREKEMIRRQAEHWETDYSKLDFGTAHVAEQPVKKKTDPAAPKGPKI